MEPALIVRARQATREASAELARHLVLVETQHRLLARRLIPVCAWCGLVTDGAGHWARLRIWKQNELTTGTCCPACLAELLPAKDSRPDAWDEPSVLQPAPALAEGSIV